MAATATTETTRKRKPKGSQGSAWLGTAQERLEAGRDAWARNHIAPEDSPEGPTPVKYAVSYGDLAANVSATDDRHAWAKACDHWKKWPSPRSSGITIERV